MSGRRARHRGERTAVLKTGARLRNVIVSARVATVLLPLVLVGVGAWQLLGAQRFDVVLVVVLLLAPVVWALAMSTWAEPSNPDVGVGLNMAAEPDLHQRLAALAKRLGVRPPVDIRVAAEPVVKVRVRPKDPVLYVGAALFWHLDTDQLDRLLARELSMLRCLRGRELHRTWALLQRVDLGRLTGDEIPIVGWLIARIGTVLEGRITAYLEACRAWADREIPSDLRCTDRDIAELGNTAEAWSLLVDRWAHPAIVMGAPLRELGSSTERMLVACTQAGLLDRPDDTATGQPAYTVLARPDVVDRGFSDWLNGEWGCTGKSAMPWSDYPRQVSVPTWRRALAEALGQLETLGGVTTASSLGDVINLLESTDLRAVENALATIELNALVAGIPPVSATPADAHDRTTSAFVDTAVRVALVDGLHVRLAWDWVWGTGLIDEAGKTLTVDGLSFGELGRPRLTHLRSWLDEHGVDLAKPLLSPDARGLDRQRSELPAPPTLAAAPA
ncbi:MAG: hypothetical protein ACRDP1_04930 [Nocardioidaceae bacterium]